MKSSLQDHTRDKLVRASNELRVWALGQVGELLVRARAQIARIDTAMPTPLRAPVQRFGEQLWRRVTARFPALAALRDRSGDREPWQPRRAEVQTPRSAADVRELVRALRDPSAEIAATAATALGEQQASELEPTCKAALREVLTNADGYFHPLVRVAALHSIAHKISVQARPADLEPLITVLRDLDAEVSMAAIYLFAERASDQVAIDGLLPIVLDETGFFLPVVRNTATLALERRGLLTSTNA